MFYTESISYTTQKPSFFQRIMKSIERLGYLRAEAELKRLGYYKEAMRVRKQLDEM